VKIEKKNLVILFFATFLVFNLNLSFFSNFNSGDTLGAKLLPFQILSGRGIFFDQYAQAVSVSTGNNYFFSHSHGHTVSNYPLLTGILAIPFYLPVYSYLAFTGQANNDGFVGASFLMEKLSASAISALTVVLVYLLLAKICTSRRRAIFFALAFAFCTQTFSISSQRLWQHVGVNFFVALSFLFIFRKKYLASLIFGILAFWSRSNLLLYVVPLLIFLGRTDRARIGRYLFVAVFGVIILFSYNWYFFGTLLGNPGTPLWAFDPGSFFGNLIGVLFSPGRGIIFYTPLFLVAMLAVSQYKAIRRDTRPLGDIIILGLVILSGSILLASIWGNWWGGHTFGDRLLTDAAVPVIFLVAIVYERAKSKFLKWLIVGLAIYSLLIQFVGVFFYPGGLWDELPVKINDQPERNWNFSDNPIARSLAAGPDFSGWHDLRGVIMGDRQRIYTGRERKCKLELINESRFLGYRKVNLRFINESNTPWLTDLANPIAFREVFYVDRRVVGLVDLPARLPYLMKPGQVAETKLLIVPFSERPLSRVEIFPIQTNGTGWGQFCKVKL
jgi:hypothetical protein